MAVAPWLSRADTSEGKGSSNDTAETRNNSTHSTDITRRCVYIIAEAVPLSGMQMLLCMSFASACVCLAK